MLLEDWRNATPEQNNLWRIARALIAWNTCTPIYYEGAIAGSEFVTYNAAKLYICLDLVVNVNFSAATVNAGALVTYDIANAAKSQEYLNFPVWNTTAAALYYNVPSFRLVNIYFSRITVTTYVFMKFNGYRLTTV
jgi:hypothetical protein